MKTPLASRQQPAPGWRRLALAGLFCLAARLAVGGEAALTVEANRHQVYLGESFLLQVSVAGSSAAEPDLARIAKARVRRLGAQTVSNVSIRFERGQMVREGFSGLVVSYEITPLEAGAFRAGPVSVAVDGRRLEAAGPTVAVTDIEAQNVVALAIRASRDTVLLDEPFAITLAVRIRRLPPPNEATDPLVPDNPPILDIPWLTPEGVKGLAGPDILNLLNRLLIPNGRPGFAVNNFQREPDPFDFDAFFSGGKRRAVFAFDRRLGNDDLEYTLSLSYTPKEEGNYVFGPVTFNGQVPVAVSTDGRAEGRHVFAVGPACTVRVVPPPEEHRPAAFTGLIGSNLAARAILDTSSCVVGDLVKLTLALSGPLRFDKMLPPKLSQQADLTGAFTVYDTTVDSDKRDGVCRFTYTLRPTRAGRLQVPPIEIAYYDLGRRAYDRVRTLAIPLEVRPAVEITATNLVGHTNLIAAVQPAADWRAAAPAPIRQSADGFRSVPLLGHPGWLAAAGAAPLLTLAGIAWQAWQRSRPRRQAARRRRRALSRACRALAAARRERAPNAAAAGLGAALRGYLVERRDLSPGCLTPAGAHDALRSAGVPAALADALRALHEPYFHGGFSGTPGPATLENDSRCLARLLAEIDPFLAQPRAGGNRSSRP